ncbi:MAG: AbrB/MazE/SpoVT family DNA-binding domain-containing protein [Candidatus Freyarchaeota archaeon]
MSDVFVKVDSKGRILIPQRIRRKLNIKNLVGIKVQGKKLIIEPIEDPLDSLERVVVRGTSDVEQEIGKLRRIAERELLKRGK